MEMNALLDIAERILDTAHVGILTTLDRDGRPWIRWMTPTFLRGDRRSLYAVTAEGFRKVDHIRENNRVAWMLQHRTMDEIIHISGTAAILDNPTLKADVLEAVGGHLEKFWRINQDNFDLVVVETVIEEVDHYDPMKGTRASSALHV